MSRYLPHQFSTSLSEPYTESQLMLTRQSPVSFTISPVDIQRLIDWLHEGWQYAHISTRSPHEAARLRNPSGSLLVIYSSGSVLVQGRDVERAVTVLERLEGVVK